MDLAQKKCVPCEGKTLPLTIQEAEALLQHISGWKLTGGATKIEKEWKCADFKEALTFANVIGGIAETENHHPEIEISWGKVEVELTTHSIGGLSENDFILAAKIDAAHR